MDTAYAIEVQNLQKYYGETHAADGVTFSVNTGEIFGLLGPNGAGKTTTVECLLGLRQPDGGEVRLLGMEHGRQSTEIRTRLGAQLQTTGLLSQLTTIEQAQLFARFYPHPLPPRQALEMVGLEEKARTRTRTLSGGQKQRLAVALALVGDPDLVFLDEPTTGLDPQARRSLWDVIRGLKQAGKTVLLTTHYMEEAEQLCDRVAVIDHGRIIELDSPHALIGKYFKEIAIEFAAPKDGARDRLESLPSVGQVLFQDGHVTVYSKDVPRTMAGLLDLASEYTLALEGITVRQATLEDVFLKLTGRRIRE